MGDNNQDSVHGDTMTKASTRSAAAKKAAKTRKANKGKTKVSAAAKKLSRSAAATKAAKTRKANKLAKTSSITVRGRVTPTKMVLQP